MNIEIVTVKGVAMTNSKNIADKFNKQHRQILDSIRRIMKDEPAFGRANFCASSYTTDQNKVLDCFEMTRDGFSMVAMSLTGKEALNWKVKYINAFNAMEAQLLKEHNTLEWKQARLQITDSRKSLTNVIRDFVEYSKSQGSKNAGMYYGNITKMEYAALQMTQQAKTAKDDGVNFRDTLDCMDLCFLATAEQVAKNAISSGMESGMHYKDIYQLAKDNVFAYADTVKLPKLGVK